jgi:hypothetical protein
MMQSDVDRSARVRRYATLIGLLGMLSLVAGGFGEAFVPSALIEPDHASVTAANIASSPTLMRWGFAAYLVEALCDVTLTMLFFALFRIVHSDAAMAGVFFRLIGTGGFAMAQVFFFASLPTVVSREPLQAFRADQLDTIALLFIRISEYSQTVFTMFYGAGTLIFGYLMYRSRFVPSWIGMLVMLASGGFMLKAVTWVLSPDLSSPLMLAPAGLAFLVLSVWMLVKGIDTAAWRAAAELGRT